MITISRSAYDRLADMLAHLPADVGVRIYLRSGRARLRPGRERPGDEVVRHQGRTVLVFDRSTAQYIEQRSLDARATENGPRLRLRRSNPNDGPREQ